MSEFLDFLQGINYFGWQSNIKIIFLSLTFVFLFIAVFSYIKVHLIMRAHHEHMLHEHHKYHGGEHGEEGAHGGVTHTEGHGDTGHDATPESPGDQVFFEAWERIQKFANSVREAEWKLAVIEADKFVDDALKRAGFAGETMGERLMLIKPDQLSSLQDLWDAHKLRNLLVHETNYTLRHEQALEAVGAFERVLRELGMLH